MRQRILVVASLLAVVAAVAGCARPLTGGWDGDIDCGGNNGDAAALFEQEGDQLDGDVYVHIGSFFGPTTFRTVVGDADLNDDGSWDIDLHYDPEDDDQGRTDFVMRVGFVDNDVVLEGEVDVINDDGEKVDECDVELVRAGERAP